MTLRFLGRETQAGNSPTIWSDDGRTGGFVRPADTELAELYRAIRDELWPRAIPSDQYASGT